MSSAKEAGLNLQAVTSGINTKTSPTPNPTQGPGSVSGTLGILEDFPSSRKMKQRTATTVPVSDFCSGDESQFPQMVPPPLGSLGLALHSGRQELLVARDSEFHGRGLSDQATVLSQGSASTSAPRTPTS